MRKLYFLITLVFIITGSNGPGGRINPETGIMELNSGEIRLKEIYSAAGVVVGPYCTLTVEGDVNAGAMFICRGGTVRITGRLKAEVVYFDSADAELRAEIGEISAKYFTQCGGTVRVKGYIYTRSRGGDDGGGLININGAYSEHGAARLTAGGIFARRGDIRTGALPPGDEASTANFFNARGITLDSYDFPSSAGNTHIRTGKGIAAMGGGTVYCDYPVWIKNIKI